MTVDTVSTQQENPPASDPNPNNGTSGDDVVMRNLNALNHSNNNNNLPKGKLVLDNDLQCQDKEDSGVASSAAGEIACFWCLELCDPSSRCPDCGLVYYCSQQHLELHQGTNTSGQG